MGQETVREVKRFHDSFVNLGVYNYNYLSCFVVMVTNIKRKTMKEKAESKETKIERKEERISGRDGFMEIFSTNWLGV